MRRLPARARSEGPGDGRGYRRRRPDDLLEGPPRHREGRSLRRGRAARDQGRRRDPDRPRGGREARAAHRRREARERARARPLRGARLLRHDARRVARRGRPRRPLPGTGGRGHLAGQPRGFGPEGPSGRGVWRPPRPGGRLGRVALQSRDPARGGRDGAGEAVPGRRAARGRLRDRLGARCRGTSGGAAAAATGSGSPGGGTIPTIPPRPRPGMPRRRDGRTTAGTAPPGKGISAGSRA